MALDENGSLMKLRYWVIPWWFLWIWGCSDSTVTQTAPAFLGGLEIIGAKTQLNPEFDPLRQRYSVIANNDGSPIALQLQAPDSVIISAGGAIVASGASYQINAPNPGDTYEISVQSGSRVRTYELLYLPPDFPELAVTTFDPKASPDPLYVSLNTGAAFFIAMLDNAAVPIYFKRTALASGDFKRHPSGERSYTVRTTDTNQWGRRSSEVVILGEDFEELRRVGTVGLSHTDGHDFLILANGNYVLLSYDGMLRDLTSFGGGPDSLVEDSVIQETDQNGQVFFQWRTWDQMPYSDRVWPRTDDYAHFNSVFADTDGNYIVSARGLAQVAKVSRSSGEVLWKLGGKSNQFTFINDPFAHLCGQHTASRLENGNILIFDNGQHCWPAVPDRIEHTRAVEYELDLDAMTATLVWSYHQPGVYTLSGGSAQRLPNGNTLISWNRGPEILATEVDADGAKVFEIEARTETGTARSYRAFRFPN